jgi:hypothetical protein
MWTALEEGRVNASDVLSRTNVMFNYGTNSDSYYDVVGALAAQGLETPNLNGTGTLSVEYRGTEHNGMLFARNVPNGSWDVNRTYNASNFEGPVMLATTDGKYIQFKSGDEFTVTGATTKDGTKQDAVNVTRYTYQTADVSELTAQMEAMQNLINEIQDRQAKGGGGGGDGPGSSGGSVPLVAVGVGLAALALIMAGSRQ